jgi:hypothetical protein
MPRAILLLLTLLALSCGERSCAEARSAISKLTTHGDAEVVRAAKQALSAR